MVEGARLESECAPKGYRGFESLPLRINAKRIKLLELLFNLYFKII